MNNDILALKEKLDKIKNLGWIECENKNKSVTGKTLENLLEINPDNFEIPDYNTVEIKSKVSKRENYIDLFCATPDSYVLWKEENFLHFKYHWFIMAAITRIIAMFFIATTFTFLFFYIFQSLKLILFFLFSQVILVLFLRWY